MSVVFSDEDIAQNESLVNWRWEVHSHQSDNALGLSHAGDFEDVLS